MDFRRFFWGLEAFSIFVPVLVILALINLVSPPYIVSAAGEALRAVGAQQWLHGFPLYPSLSDGGCYSTPYGPVPSAGWRVPLFSISTATGSHSWSIWSKNSFGKGLAPLEHFKI